MVSRTLNNDDPELYVELLAMCQEAGHHSPQRADTSKQYSPPIDMDALLDKPLSVFLGTLTSILVIEPGNSAAAAASILSPSSGQLDVTIYYAFNSATDTQLANTQKYLQNILSHLRRIRPPPAGPPLDTAALEIAQNIIECVHIHCWELFKKRVNKRWDLVEIASKALRERGDSLNPDKRSTYATTLFLVRNVVRIVDDSTKSGTLCSDNSHDLLAIFIRLIRLKILPDIDQKRDYTLLEEFDNFVGESLLQLPFQPHLNSVLPARSHQHGALDPQNHVACFGMCASRRPALITVASFG